MSDSYKILAEILTTGSHTTPCGRTYELDDIQLRRSEDQEGHCLTKGEVVTFENRAPNTPECFHIGRSTERLAQLYADRIYDIVMSNPEKYSPILVHTNPNAESPLRVGIPK